MTKTQPLATEAPSGAFTEYLTALWIQPGMCIEFMADGAIVSGTVEASTSEPIGPEFMGATPQRILATVDGQSYALMPAHACRVLSGRELAQMNA